MARYLVASFMHKFLLLIAIAALLTDVAAAQKSATTPAGTPPPASATEKFPWLIFDQPLDDVGGTYRRHMAHEKQVRPGSVLVPAPRATAQHPTRVTRTAFEATQGAIFVPLDPDTYRLMDRYAIKFGSDSLHDPHTSVRPYTRVAAAHLGERILGVDSAQASRAGSLSRSDRFNARYLLQDNWTNSTTGNGLNQSSRPLLNYFYRNQTDFYHVDAKGFTLRVNPVALFSAGRDNQNSDGIRYVNTRGVQLEGTIDPRLGFYAFLTGNQERVPQYVQNRIARDTIVPHEGYWKYVNPLGGLSYDFITARGGLTYAATKHITIEFAHDRNFIGNGYRSLILSDYSAPYFFLKINTRVWKLNYQNIFAELIAEKKNADQLYPKKYMALHHLSLDVGDHVNVGVFESIISGGPGRGLEVQYLNPLIFYKAVEQQVGSTDKALLGADFKWNILHRAQLYGQLVINEFRIREILSGNGWWGNKQPIQLGGKLLDIGGIRNLDLQVEVNYVRPYSYQAKIIYTNYTNYQQPLAHPMGANLAEILGVLSYQPLPRLNIVGKVFYTVQGLDYGYDASNQIITSGPFMSVDDIKNQTTTGRLANYGGNPLIPYDPRPMDFGNRVGQGNKSRLLHTDFTASYQPRLNLFLDAKLIARHQTYSLTPTANVNEVYASLALRWNIAQRLHEF